jgi:hypothetical protein
MDPSKGKFNGILFFTNHLMTMEASMTYIDGSAPEDVEVHQRYSIQKSYDTTYLFSQKRWPFFDDPQLELRQETEFASPLISGDQKEIAGQQLSWITPFLKSIIAL